MTIIIICDNFPVCDVRYSGYKINDGLACVYEETLAK